MLLLATVCLMAVSAEEAKAQEVKKTDIPMKYFIVREDCYEKFLKFDVSDMDCVKFTISKGIGFAIVVGSFIVKLPQIIKIVNSGSVEGLSTMTYYIEVSAVTNLIACRPPSSCRPSPWPSLRASPSQCTART